MKKAYPMIISALVFCLAALTGCSAREDKGNSQKGLYLAVSYEAETIPEPEGRDVSWHLLGRQFYQEEALQIWAVNVGSKLDIYLCHSDGSRDLLLEAAPLEYNTNWYLDEEGNCYIYGNELLIKLDKDGQELYRQTQDTVMDICQLQDGRIMLLVQEEDHTLRLAEFDSKTGIISRLGNVSLEKGNTQYISAGGSGLLLMDNNGIWDISLKDGSRESLLPFLSTYSPGGLVSDFQYIKDGAAQVLLKGGVLHRLQLYDIADYREVIVIRDTFFDNAIIKCIDMFNQQSDDYYVVMESRESTTDLISFREHTNLELAAGRGADIICMDAVSDIWELVANGIFENMEPYMERDGIREDDFFPVAFDCWRIGDSIYGVNLYTGLSEFWIDKELLDGSDTIDIKSLIRALYSYGGEAIFREYSNSDWLLGYFLGNTESLWGMVDWEENTCDFSGELFAGILEVSKRYGDDGTQALPCLGETLYTDECDYYNYNYCTRREEAEGRIFIGFLSDNGSHAEADTNGLMGISSSSAHKEGAWEFIRFTLSQEVQETISDFRTFFIPVNKAAYDKCGKRAIAEGCIVEKDGTVYLMGGDNNSGQMLTELKQETYRELFDPTEEGVAKIKAAMEEARPRTIFRTQKILSIISEEAAAYFAGDKSLEETVAIIQNRVQLYLDEMS